ncbi:MAG: hypothetical protein HY706_03660 [Candidatus Hydrogenedentes bacterium]|nr:hypothetical protein [Candidatus Hydrogenedentota bacterium]
MNKEGMGLTLAVLVAGLRGFGADEVQYSLQVLPAERQQTTDPETGAELTFLTTNPARDTNLYFHERSWLPNGSLILFYSQREDGGLMGYITATGELVRIATPSGGVGQATASINRSSVFVTRGQEVLELALEIEPSTSPEASRSKVTCTERTICVHPYSSLSSYLNQSCDGKYLSAGCSGPASSDTNPGIVIINVSTGEYRELCRIPPSIGYGGHVQWSHTNPDLLSFAGRAGRLWVVDIRDGQPRNVYKQWPDELVTHESWWVDDQLLFCGGVHPRPTEDSHVKLLNLATGHVRIVGEGSWWPNASPSDIAKRNWWHADGSDDGRWVVADNWHGDIMLFEGKTGRPRLLTAGHRTYGSGDHPHVGWDRRGRQVVFASQKLGNSDVCVATVPETWQKENP